MGNQTKTIDLRNVEIKTDDNILYKTVECSLPGITDTDFILLDVSGKTGIYIVGAMTYNDNLFTGKLIFLRWLR